VVAGPAAGLLVPPHELLALAPGPAPGVGRGAVVEDPPVGGPGPAPVRGDLALLRAGAAAPGLVDPVRVDAGVDPAAAAGGAVVLHLREGVQRAAGPLPGEVAAVDLGEHRLGVRLPALVDRVVPGEVEDRAVPRVGRAAELLADAAPELVHELEVAAGVVRRFHGLIAPLHHPLGLGEGAGLLGMV